MSNTNTDKKMINVMKAFICPALYPLIDGVNKGDTHLIKDTIVNYALNEEYPIDFFNVFLVDEICHDKAFPKDLSEWYDIKGGIGDFLSLRMITEDSDLELKKKMIYNTVPKDKLYELYMNL